MKKALFILAAVAASVSAIAQGTITFANANIPTGLPEGGVYRVDIMRPDGTTGAGAGFTAGLFKVGSTTPLLTSAGGNGTLGFRTTTSQGVFANLATELRVDGVQPGSTTQLQLKVWETAAGSWEASTTRSAETDGIFTSRPLGGPNPIPGDPAFATPGMTGLRGTGGTFGVGQTMTITMVVVPEPSTMALGALGLGALLLRRRR